MRDLFVARGYPLRGGARAITVAAAMTLTTIGGAARAEYAIIEAPIVDGRRATASEVLATVALTDPGGDSVCTGTLIAPQVVMTAAHCVVEQDETTGQVLGVFDPADVGVVAGALSVASASSAQRYGVTRIVVHPGYPNDSPSSHPSGAGRFDDVALLILDRQVAGLTPAPVPTVNEAMAQLTAGTRVIISGYGATSANTDDSGVLYIAESSFEARVDAEIVVGRQGQPDTCPGDSGGPVYLKVGSATWAIGVTSRASENAVATCGEGGVYAFAPAYRDWFVANSQGLYTATGSTGPVTPTDPNDPNDPDDEDDEDDWDDWDDDEGCAGGQVPGALLGGLVGLIALRALRSRWSAATR